MNDADAKIKQQIVDKIKSSTNIMVTVSRDPSVDDLSAMLGLTAVLNKLGKHATAIFSGAIPPAITFLEPDKIIENTADSLRDFIIALDKEKADHLRYKVDGDMVKIFITPYRTNITSDDLEFSQGDYNVELVLALGVTSKEHLDAALTAHGSVLDNVTIATIGAGELKSDLGDMDWNDKDAGSLSEMVAILGEAYKSDKPLLDKQIATALLTGIVAATDRFSNPKTTARVMTTAAQLMAAGADQQLIAAKLQETHEIKSLTPNPADVKPETIVNTAAPTVAPTPEAASSEISTLPPDNFMIKHEEVAPTVTVAPPLPQPEEPSLMSTLPPETIPSTLPPEIIAQPAVSSLPPETAVEPSFGGTLNATAEQAAQDARRELDDQQNTTTLTHSYLSSPDSTAVSPINGIGQTEDNKTVDIFATAPSGQATPINDSIMAPIPVIQPPKFDMPLPPPLPDFSTLPPQPVAGFNIPVPTQNPISAPAPILNDPTQFRIPGQ
jgi:hypothetical protein